MNYHQFLLHFLSQKVTYLIKNKCSSTSHSFLRKKREISRKQLLKNQIINENFSESRSKKILITKINDASIITLICITLRLVT